MTTNAIIQKTVKTLSKLPPEKAAEVSDFADYMLKKHEEYTLVKENEINSNRK